MFPYHLANLAGVDRLLTFESDGATTIEGLLDEIESFYPSLRGTIRDQSTKKRRAFLRYFACQEDLSNLPESSRLPDEVLNGEEPFIILASISGG